MKAQVVSFMAGMEKMFAVNVDGETIAICSHESSAEKVVFGVKEK